MIINNRPPQKVINCKEAKYIILNLFHYKVTLMKKRNRTNQADKIQYTGLCLTVGAVFGILVSLLFTKNIIALCAGTALGLITGTIIDSYTNRKAQK